MNEDDDVRGTHSRHDMIEDNRQAVKGDHEFATANFHQHRMVLYMKTGIKNEAF